MRFFLTIFVFHNPINCKIAKERYKITKGFFLAVRLLFCDRLLEYTYDAFRVVVQEYIRVQKFPNGNSYQVL